jgi:hypothetical protein
LCAAQEEPRRIGRLQAPDVMVHYLKLPSRSADHPLLCAEHDAIGRAALQNVRNCVLEVLLLDEVVTLIE